MKLLYKSIANRVNQISLLLILLCSTTLFGQANIFKEESPVFTSNQIAAIPSTFLFKDSEIMVPNHISLNPKAYIKLKANSDSGPFVWTRTSLNLTITPIMAGGAEDTANQYQQTLTVEYNPLANSANFNDLALHELKNVYGVKVVVDSYTITDRNTGAVTNNTGLSSNITLQLGFESERYYQVTQQISNLQASIVNDTDATPVAVQFNWTPLAGALEYELEWTWVDNYSQTNTSSNLNPGQIKFSTRDFELNNTRIRTSQLNYQIPLVYSKGYLIYRIRAVGRFIDDINTVNKTFYGPWSSGLTLKSNVAEWENCYILIPEHEVKKNWQFQASYAEQGKKKEVVSYFDGSLRNRQTVTKVNTDNNTIVGEVIYDAQGRPAIEVLPVPLDKNYIRYFKELNLRDGSNTIYSHLDFDWETENANSCSSSVSKMSLNNGSSKYYSSNNNIVSPFSKFIPDAKLYPFSQTEYTPDNTGRIVRKGGVGEIHQLGSSHEMKYYYSVPSQEELNRLFGYEVGYVSHYKKNIVVDPNGQVSVSYLDPQGKTVATALAGSKPNSLVGLEDESNTDLHKIIGVDLLAKTNPNDANTSLDNNELETSNNFENYKDILSLSKQLGVAGTNVSHKFEYKVKNSDFFKPRFCNDNFSFVYDLNIALKDECAIDKFNPQIINQQIGSQSIINNGNPSTFNQTVQINPNPLYLNTGAYTLTKDLTVNKDALNAYADHYVTKLTTPGSECYINPSQYSPQLEVSCETTCQECVTTIGTKSDYILKQLKQLYNVPADNNSVFSINTEYVVSVIISQPGGSINYGQVISQTEVTAFSERFADDWDALSEFCEQLCGPTFVSSCEVNERTLLKDVSPDGQYGYKGITDDNNVYVNNDPLSIFNDTTTNQIIYNGQVVNNNWRNPITPYLDDNNVEEHIIVTPSGTGYTPEVANLVTPMTNADGDLYILPGQLKNVNDFLNRWKESWAKSLLPYHPEFCYLTYADRVCELRSQELQIPNYDLSGAVISTQNKRLSSDEYDGYLQHLDTRLKAEQAGLFDFSSPFNNEIFTNDPYFSSVIPGGVETPTQFNLRKNLMLFVLNEQYEGVRQTPNGDYSNLFQAAAQMAKCNAIQTCNYPDVADFSSYTDAEKDRLWNTYKALYISFKGKIKYVFSNVYAISNGCFNGCIGGQTSPSQVMNVLVNYPTQVGQINQSITPPTTVFCDNPAAVNYNNKQKRFIPIDNGYNSSIPGQDALNQLVAQGTYQYYVQTGSCPLINDLNLFIDGYFKDLGLENPTLVNPITNYHRVGQALSAKLFGEFAGYQLPLPSLDTPALNTQISSALGGYENVLSFTFTPTQIGFSPASRPLVLTIPQSANLSWNNYGITGYGDWRIVAFSQLYYDRAASSLSGPNPVFGFSVIARVALDNGTFKDIVLTGKTLARIGECHIEGDGNGVGEVITPVETACNKKELFGNALKDLMNHLISIGQVNTTYNLSNNSFFNNSFLKTYFGIQSGDLVTWIGSTSYSNYKININGVERFRFESDVNVPSITSPIEFIRIGGISSYWNGSAHGVSVKILGNPTIYDSYGINGGKKSGVLLYFACCAPCGEWDFNGNGIGDLCDVPVEPICEQKKTFGNALKDLVNHLYSIGQLNNNYDLTNDQFFNSNYLYQYFGISNGTSVTWSYDEYGELGTGYWINSGDNFTFLFNTGSQINSPLSELTIIGDGQVIFSYYDNGNLSNETGGISFRYGKFGKSLYFDCDNSPCGEWDHNYNGVGDLCDNEHSYVSGCKSVSDSEEKAFETKFKNVLNDYIQYHSGDASNASVDHTLVSSNIAMNDFVNSSSVPQHFGTSLDDLYYYTIQSNEQDFLTSIDFYAPIADVQQNKTILFGFNPISVATQILAIDIIDEENVVVKYKDLSGVYQTMMVPLSFRTYSSHLAGHCFSSTTGIANSCIFLSNDYNNWNVTSTSNCNGPGDGEISMMKVGKMQGKTLKEERKCGPCIPQTVAPMTADEKYPQYVNFFNFNANGESVTINYLSNTSILELEDFRASNLQYVVDSYITYINTLGITSTENPNYLNIVEFADTDLNFGYNNITSVINLYKAYANLNASNPERKFWNEYVNTVYVQTLMTDCPPQPMPTYSIPIEIHSPCEEMLQNIASTYKLDSYNAYIASLRQEFIEDYINQAMSKVVENFTMEYSDKEYQYTLYYYDQAGNLIQTVAPEGVDRISSTLNSSINNIRLGTTPEVATSVPDHKFKTQYKYNSLNQLVWQSTPDGGITEFAYDYLGRIIASQNAKQKDENLFSYTTYDYLGRITQAGQVFTDGSYSINPEGRLMFTGAVDPVNNFDETLYRNEVTRTVYSDDPEIENTGTKASDLFITNIANEPLNNRNRVTGVFYHGDFDPNNLYAFDNAILYNYDVHGNVKEMINYYTFLRDLQCSETQISDGQGQMVTNDCQPHIKRVVYNYDLISGNVNSVAFQPNKNDQFIHKYNYDADNRIVSVETSKDGVIWEKDANYQYYPHGPLARVEIGDKKVQGTDYAYTLQGWLKGVNGENLRSPENDMGKDGLNSNVAKDAYGYSLSYHDNDYKAIDINDDGTNAFKPLMFSRNNSVGPNTRNLYNGNIKQMTTAIRTGGDNLLDVQKNNYAYDQLNRIKEMVSVGINPSVNGIQTFNNNSYSSSYIYDKNGNIKELNRTAPVSNVTNQTPEPMDVLKYDYIAGTNKLALVHDKNTSVHDFVNDLKNQKNQLADLGITYDIDNTDSHNYVYDKIGQLIEDKTEGLSIEWRVDGKVKTISRDYGFYITSFLYDGLGNRIAKTNYSPNDRSSSKNSTVYARDAQGNVLGVYNYLTSTTYTRGSVTVSKNLKLKEHHIYGSSRLGLEDKNITVYQYSKGGKVILMKNDDQATADTALKAAPVAESLIPPVAVSRDYSLHFYPNSTLATWPIQASGASPLASPLLDNFGLNTKFKWSNSNGLADGNYKLGQLMYQGQIVEQIPGNSTIEYLPIFNPVRSAFNETCIAVTLSNATIPGVTLPQGALINLSRTTLMQISPELRQMSKVAQDNQKIEDPGDNPSPCIEEASAIVPALNAGESGFISYNVNSTNLSNSHNVMVGFNVNGNYYGFRTYRVGSLINLVGVNAGVETALGQVVNGDLLTIQRDINQNGEQSFELLRQTGTILGILDDYSTGINNDPADLFLKFGEHVGTLTTGNGGRINNLRVGKTVITSTQTKTTTVTNQLELFVNKAGNNFTPTVTIRKYTSNNLGQTTSEKRDIVGRVVPQAELTAQGLDLNFYVKIGQATANAFSVNGVGSSVPSLITLQSDSSTVPTAVTNWLGNNSTEIDMCFFNYFMSNTSGSVVNAFTYDLANGQALNVAPVSTSGITMTVTPQVVRTLTGPCLVDSDGDGLFDIYEVNADLSFIDTDGDGIMNHMDPDDDGDGIYTKFEHADDDNDGNPNPNPVATAYPYTGIAPLNTDGVANAVNPNMVTDTIPNYLDVDDDGDNYATWETFEGGPGSFNATTTGVAYTQDTDGDTKPDYLDYSDQIYPENGEFSFANYLNTVGDKRYELANHLGNVLVVVNDKKIPSLSQNGTVLNYFNADIISYSDYYPFGSLIPNRSGNTPGYRYGFQGQEMDNEIKGDGNSLNYTFRMHDPRVGRFFAVDPLTKKYPYLTPYQFSSNQPIHATELEGKESSNEIGIGAKVNYSLGGGFTGSLFAGLFTKGKIGDVGGMASLNVAATMYLGGPGTSPMSPSLFTLTATPALTLGLGSGSSMNLNLFNSQSGSGVNNSFDSSLTYGRNYIFSTGKNSDGSGRNQITGAVAVKLGNIQVASYNDTDKFPFYGPRTDQFWSAGLNASVKIGNLTAIYSFDCYYGLSDIDATYDQDRIIGGVNFDNQNIMDMLLNNGIEKLSLQHSQFGTMQSGSVTGSLSFWPSNQMHDAIQQPSIRKPDATFHHLFVPFDNGMTKPSFSKFNKYLKGTTFDNSFFSANKIGPYYNKP